MRTPYINYGGNASRRDTQVTLESRLAPFGAFAAVDMNRSKPIKFPMDNGVTVFEWSYATAPAIGPVISFLQEYLTVTKLSWQSKQQAFVIMDKFRLPIPFSAGGLFRPQRKIQRMSDFYKLEVLSVKLLRIPFPGLLNSFH